MLVSASAGVLNTCYQTRCAETGSTACNRGNQGTGNCRYNVNIKTVEVHHINAFCFKEWQNGAFNFKFLMIHKRN